MTENTVDTVESTEQDDVETPEDVAEVDDTGETFSREYVESLRQESAKYRDRAKGADDLRHRLHDALVNLDGRLADPTDLTYADEHLDGDALADAITALIESKPHLARRPSGDVGQGVRSESAVPKDFSGLFS
ncbi:hypothetical protein [Mycolicibacterium neworleansense]|uniref:Uncharacterized protein n=1 Tax=Mycolicibacterium neworleansense TaxID=146018 RepID=A0A0H5RV20_9MYCO|nr:hypothetical protein [Mycolicibacterium neworleansense]MCV7365475.1 hypothetical protein [Mycolicibacterium neworleansense]CRZ17985.1 hypothetical protein BN2156_04882 [Mycolicibacterium neworleansense]